MASHRTIDTKLFKDRWVRSLHPLDKLLFVYFLTNISTNIAGAYEIEMSDIELDTGLSASEIDEALIHFREAGKVFYEDGWVYIANFIKHQKYESEKIQAGILTIINNSPSWIKNRVSNQYFSLSHLILFNSIQSNSISEEKDTEEVKTDLRGRSGIPRTTIPINQSLDLETNIWLDAVAAAVGAKSAKGLPKFRKWQDVCQIAVQGQLDLGKFLKIIESEKERNKGQEEFFSPDTCLQKLQLNGSKATSKWMHDV